MGCGMSIYAKAFFISLALYVSGCVFVVVTNQDGDNKHVTDEAPTILTEGHKIIVEKNSEITTEK